MSTPSLHKAEWPSFDGGSAKDVSTLPLFCTVIRDAALFSRTLKGTPDYIATSRQCEAFQNLFLSILRTISRLFENSQGFQCHMTCHGCDSNSASINLIATAFLIDYIPHQRGMLKCSNHLHSRFEFEPSRDGDNELANNQH